jgi:hypothetical protein
VLEPYAAVTVHNTDETPVVSSSVAVVVAPAAMFFFTSDAWASK